MLSLFSLPGLFPDITKTQSGVVSKYIYCFWKSDLKYAVREIKNKSNTLFLKKSVSHYLTQLSKNITYEIESEFTSIHQDFFPL